VIPNLVKRDDMAVPELFTPRGISLVWKLGVVGPVW